MEIETGDLRYRISGTLIARLISRYLAGPNREVSSLLTIPQTINEINFFHIEY